MGISIEFFKNSLKWRIPLKYFSEKFLQDRIFRLRIISNYLMLISKCKLFVQTYILFTNSDSKYFMFDEIVPNKTILQK